MNLLSEMRIDKCLLESFASNSSINYPDIAPAFTTLSS
jgi:hypothetical protein